jgi:hypothetical protein
VEFRLPLLIALAAATSTHPAARACSHLIADAECYREDERIIRGRALSIVHDA